MWDWITKNAKNIGVVGNLASGAGLAYGTYMQGKEAKRVNDINLDIYNTQKATHDKTQANFDAASAAVFGTAKKKNDNQLVL